MYGISKKAKTNETDLYPAAKRQRSDECDIPSNSHFQCEYCNNTFSNLPNLNQHIAAFHLKNSTWACSKCNKVNYMNKNNILTIINNYNVFSFGYSNSQTNQILKYT